VEKKRIIEEVLPVVMGYVTCLELSTVAAVNKHWRTVAFKSYHARVNQTWNYNQLSTNTAFLYPGSDKNTRYMIEGYKKMKRRQDNALACGVRFNKSLYELQTNKWRFQIASVLLGPNLEYIKRTTWVRQIEASVLPLLERENGLPEPLLSAEGVLY